jgi:prenyltransferase beta subunit
MRLAIVAIFLAAPAARAQTPEVVKAVEDKLGTIRYLLKLEHPDGGFAAAPGKGASLGATSAAIRGLKYNGIKPIPEKHAAFVMACFDPKTGGFADAPGGKSNVRLTSVGVMAAVELGVPKERFRKALDYLKDNAKEFEDARIAAGAIEAWGVKEYPYPLKPFVEAGRAHLKSGIPLGAAGAREVGSVAALLLRLGETVGQQERQTLSSTLKLGQRGDGGWGKQGAKTSDLETTYRIMRALKLLEERPTNAARFREFVASCRNADGGYGVTPGAPSEPGATYFAAIVLHWLAELEK